MRFPKNKIRQLVVLVYRRQFMFKLPQTKIHWANTIFLTSTLLISVVGVPIYLWNFGLDLFQVALFFFFTFATGMGITLGYHRLFSHLTFHAAWPVKLWTLLFGAAAFEGSALAWSADHRRHHKFVDHDDDPYDISKGLFHAHIGWLIFRHSPDTPLTWVRDLQKDRLAWWQHSHYLKIAFGMGFFLPTLIGFAWAGWQGALGALILSGFARTVVVHHSTFCINSLCHWIGERPYSTKCTARDSFLMAVCTFGEGYHNYHHEFQYDYRNGVKPWQYDPTKWAIWALNKIGLAWKLRTVPEEVILKAQIAERQHCLTEKLSSSSTPISDALHDMVQSAQQRMHDAVGQWEVLLAEYREAAEKRGQISRRQRRELRNRVAQAMERVRESVREWGNTHQLVYRAMQAA